MKCRTPHCFANAHPLYGNGELCEDCWVTQRHKAFHQQEKTVPNRRRSGSEPFNSTLEEDVPCPQKQPLSSNTRT